MQAPVTQRSRGVHICKSSVGRPSASPRCPPTGQRGEATHGADIWQGSPIRPPPPPAVCGPLQLRLQSDAAKVGSGTLHPWCASFLHRSEHGPPRAVVLLLHGFTSGPWQYFHISQRLTRGGLDVYAPRLPGHGRMDGNLPAPQRLPGLYAQDRYRAFAEAAYREAKCYARERGVPLWIMGFSLGGGLAADLASAHPRSITRLVAAAPLLRPKPLHARLAYAAARLGRHCRGGRYLLRHNYYQWMQGAPAAVLRPPPLYWRFALSKMFACLDYNKHMQRRLRPPDMPTQVIVTDCDEQCDGAYTRRWLRTAPAGQVGAPRFLYRLDRSCQVSHAALAEVDIKGPSRMTQVAVQFLLIGVGTSATLVRAGGLYGGEMLLVRPIG